MVYPTPGDYCTELAAQIRDAQMVLKFATCLTCSTSASTSAKLARPVDAASTPNSCAGSPASEPGSCCPKTMTRIYGSMADMLQALPNKISAHRQRQVLAFRGDVCKRSAVRRAAAMLRNRGSPHIVDVGPEALWRVLQRIHDDHLQARNHRQSQSRCRRGTASFRE